MEPIGIVFVNSSEQVEQMARICRVFLKKADMNTVNVLCLCSSYELEHIEIFLNNRQWSTVDILVVPVFCFQKLINRFPKMFESQRLRFIWFHEIDEMYQNDATKINNTVDKLFSQGDCELQVR